MSEPKKNITLNGLTTVNMIYLIISICILLISAYLTNHFYQLHFPSGLNQSSSLCNINDFFSCNKTTLSSFSHFAGIPISFGGIFIGLIGICGAFIQSEALEKTNKLIHYINAIGCLVLFVISTVVLNSICPFCFIYYLLSFAAAFLFFRYSDYSVGFDLKLGGIYALLVLIPSFFMWQYYADETSKKNLLSKQYVEQFKALKDYGPALYISPFRLETSGLDFKSAPIRISVFSDFQCPFCKKVAEDLAKVFTEFKGQIEVQYHYYPLDIYCNKEMQRSLHAYACKAAYLAACDENKFLEIHDFLFENQDKINQDNLEKWEKKFGLKNCLNNSRTTEYVQQSLNAGKQYELRSTPTMIINGKKLEGSLAPVYLKAILNSLVK